MKSRILLFFLILFTNSLIISCHASTQINPDLPKLSISSIIQDSNFQCSPKQTLINIYHESTSILNKKNIPITDDGVLIMNKYMLTGIKNLSRFNRHHKDTDEEVLSYDIDVFHHNLHILRFAIYIFEGNDTESAGFYYIIHGSPKEVINKLNTANIDLSYLNIEETPAHNTRIRCTMVG